MTDLLKGAKIAVENCLQVKPGEKVLVITDEPCRNIGRALWEAAKQAQAEAMIVEILPRSNNGEEPPTAIAEMMKNVDVFFAPTSKSLSHTDARRNACKAGARGATLPGIREDSFARTLSADYHQIAERSQKLSDILNTGKVARVTTPLGTDITMNIEGRKSHPDHGLVFNPGEFSNLPAGEAYLAPVEGTANGVFYVDGSIGDTGILTEPIKIVVKDGYAIDITGGGDQLDVLMNAINPHGKDAFNIAELGIGTNDKAEICGSVLEDEKVLGTIHIALGDNQSMGGVVAVPSHQDGIVTKPTVYVDDKVILKDGEIVI